jgi:hypothetical protein
MALAEEVGFMADAADDPTVHGMLLYVMIVLGLTTLIVSERSANEVFRSDRGSSRVDDSR